MVRMMVRTMKQVTTYKNKMIGRTNPPTIEPSLVFEIDKLNNKPDNYSNNIDKGINEGDNDRVVESKLD